MPYEKSLSQAIALIVDAFLPTDNLHDQRLMLQVLPSDCFFIYLVNNDGK